jgi:16S rRNA (guanine527-N7)-methyltransferase
MAGWETAKDMEIRLRMIYDKNTLGMWRAKIWSSLIPLPGCNPQSSYRVAADLKTITLEPEDLILKYFPDLTDVQIKRFGKLGPLYREWNARINVISRQDIDNLYERHILHSLAIARIVRLKAGTRVLDAGTGGGFPGIPLAICFPDVHFQLVDSTDKKLLVVRAIADEIGLRNVTTRHTRLENHHDTYDFVVSRAVASLDLILDWTFKNVKSQGINELDNGILYLRGGSIEPLNNRTIHHKIYPLSDYFREEFFETKYLVHLFKKNQAIQ